MGKIDAPGALPVGGGRIWEDREDAMMTMLHAGRGLTTEERMARRRLMVQDAVALLTLFLTTVVLFALTYLLYRSFENHRQDLGQRWKMRGERELAGGQPKQAVDELRSALAYVPDRGTEIELATALAAAGRTTEATAYFNTLWESAPGDGTINLQLARLAARQGNEANALFHYQAALDGTWQGNGYDRRREIRLEMVSYLLTRGHVNQARTQLLIAAGNAPDQPEIKMQIAALMEKAQDLPDALGIYRAIAARRGAPFGAVEAAGRTAYSLGMDRVSAQYLSRAAASPSFAELPEGEKTADRGMLQAANRILALYPAYDLAARTRAERILKVEEMAHARLTACTSGSAGAPAQLAEVIARWAQAPQRVTAAQLEQQPDVEQAILQLAYDTETASAKICGPPTGDDALLLEMARNPEAVEHE